MNIKYKHAVAFIWSRDIKKTEHFYEGILGFKRAFESDGWIEMAVPGIPNAFVAINKWEKPGTYPANEFLTFGVDNIDTFKAHLLAEEVTLKGDIVEFSEQGLRMLKFYDHDKNIITITEISK